MPGPATSVSSRTSSSARSRSARAARRSSSPISARRSRLCAASADGHEPWFPDEGLDLERYIEGVELTLIKRSLERTQGNKVQAARLLNLKRTTLIEKLKRLERGQPGV